MEKPFTLDEVSKKNLKKKLNVYKHFSTMIKNNAIMLQQFVENNASFRNMDV
jgi:hypothetical protein